MDLQLVMINAPALPSVIGYETVSWSAKAFYDLLPSSSLPEGFVYENDFCARLFNMF